MNSFPLYDNLKKNISKKELTDRQKTEFIKKFSMIDDNGQELIYVLIQFFSIKNSENFNNKLPYKGKIIDDNDILWNINNLPCKLQKILYKFLNMHLKKMKEDIKRAEN